MKKMFILIGIILIITTSTAIVKSDSIMYGVPYDTYTLNSDKDYIQTQTAYIPVGYIGNELEFDEAQDIYFYNDYLYIADTGNMRIIKLSLNGELSAIYESETFIEITGLFVKDNYIYIADKGSRAVYIFDENNQEIIKTILKPTSPIFGQNNEFIPLKVVVDSSNSIYVIGEGSTSGVIQLDYEGEFIGYLGINSVEVSLRKLLYNFFVTDSNLSSNRPASPTNIAIGNKGSILTTNVNVTETFKRLNITGVNTLNSDTVYPDAELADIWMGADNYIYIVTKIGEIYEYDENGNMLFYFNAANYGVKQSLGLIHKASGIVTDDQGNLYILDSGYNGYIHIYQKTSFVDLLHKAVTLFNDGMYIESKEYWLEIQRQNSSFALAHTALGYAYLKEGQYNLALSEFKAANDYTGYSLAYWEIRNDAIQKNLGLWLISGVGVLILFKIIKKILKNSEKYNKFKKENKLKDNKTFKELIFSIKVLKNPYDTYLSIRRMNVASIKSGWIVLSLFIFVYLINVYLTGYLFRTQHLNQIIFQFFTVLGLFGLYVIVNYLVSSLNDGEGRLRDVFIASSYALIPFIIFTLPMTLLSHFITYNETFIYSFYNDIILVWTLLLLFISIQSIHNYRFFETIKNIFIIIFGLIIVILTGLLIYSFVGQILMFILSIIKEVIYRV